MEKPEAYRMKVRDRKGIVAEIMNLTDQQRYGSPYYLCLDVKLYDLDFSFENLLEHWRKNEGNDPRFEDAGWLDCARRRFGESQDQLWNYGVKGVEPIFVGYNCSGIPDGDTFSHLWDGTKLFVRYAFVGRCGGWLAITHFEGYRFDRQLDYYFEDTLMELDFLTLKRLYQLILMLVHDTREESRKAEVEYQAAFSFFANICEDIPYCEYCI